MSDTNKSKESDKSGDAVIEQVTEVSERTRSKTTDSKAKNKSDEPNGGGSAQGKPTKDSSSEQAAGDVDSATLSPTDKLIQRENEIKSEIIKLIEDSSLPIEEGKEIKVGIEECLGKCVLEKEISQDVPEFSIPDLLKVLEDDQEDWDFIYESTLERIHRERERQKQIKQQRERLRELMEVLDDVQHKPRNDIESIAKKVDEEFLHLRHQLSKVMKQWCEDIDEDEQEMQDAFSLLCDAYLQEGDPQEQFVDSRLIHRDILEKLIRNRIVYWNKEHTHVKIYL